MTLILRMPQRGRRAARRLIQVLWLCLGYVWVLAAPFALGGLLAFWLAGLFGFFLEAVAWFLLWVFLVDSELEANQE